METEIIAEWISASEHDRKVRAAIRKASAKQVADGQPPLDLQEELDNGYLDYADPENSAVTRKFPNVGLALGWAKRNCGQALWHEIHIHENTVPPEAYDEVETLRTWRVHDGELIDEP